MSFNSSIQRNRQIPENYRLCNTVRSVVPSLNFLIQMMQYRKALCIKTFTALAQKQIHTWCQEPSIVDCCVKDKPNYVCKSQNAQLSRYNVSKSNTSINTHKSSKRPKTNRMIDFGSGAACPTFSNRYNSKIKSLGIFSNTLLIIA